MSRVSTTVFSKTGIPIQLEGSGRTAKAAIDDLYAGIEYGMKTHGWTTEPKNQAPIQESPVVPNMPIVKTPIAKAGPESTEKKTGSLVVSKMKSTPRPDKKVELQFFEKGHKYVDIYHVADRAEVLEQLQNTGLPWSENDLAEANEFAAVFIVDWIESDRLNSNNKPYKDVTGFRPYPNS